MCSEIKMALLGSAIQSCRWCDYVDELEVWTRLGVQRRVVLVVRQIGKYVTK